MSDPQGRRPRADRSTEEQDLRSTSDSIQEHARRLASIEGEKRRLPADDPRVDALSERAVELADTLARQTRAERKLSDELD